MRFWILSLMLLQPVPGEGLPDGALLMAKADAALERFHSIQFVLDRKITVGAVGNKKQFSDKTAVIYVNPGKLRVETSGGLANGLLISDTKQTWVYGPKSKSYWRTPAAMSLVASISSLGLPTRPGVTNISMNAQTLGQEVINIDGQPHDCWVVQNTGDDLRAAGPAHVRNPVWTLWLDKELGFALKSTLVGDIQRSDVLFHLDVRAAKRSLKLGAPVADTRFAFVAPDNTHETFGDEMEPDLFVDTNLTGGEARPFVKTQVERIWGGSLPELAGKTLLLAFSPTWCQPCRWSMPVLDKLNHEFQEHGLAIIQITQGESDQALDSLLKAIPVSFPVVRLKAEKSEGYIVSGYPTFVIIDQDQNIVGSHTGFSSAPDTAEQTLRQILAQAGVGTVANVAAKSMKRVAITGTALKSTKKGPVPD